MNYHNKQHYVFDVDDTLTDARELNQSLFVRTFLPYININKETETYLRDLHTRSRGTAMISQFAEATSYLKLKIDLEQLVRENEQLHVEHDTTADLFPGAEKFLKKLKNEGINLFVCTNRQKRSLVKILKRNGVWECFEEIVSCSDAGYEKPQPNCLIKLMKDKKMKKEKVMFWGDSPTDAQFAKNAGVDCMIIDHYLNQKKFYERFI